METRQRTISYTTVKYEYMAKKGEKNSLHIERRGLASAEMWISEQIFKKFTKFAHSIHFEKVQ